MLRHYSGGLPKAFAGQRKKTADVMKSGGRGTIVHLSSDVVDAILWCDSAPVSPSSPLTQPLPQSQSMFEVTLMSSIPELHASERSVAVRREKGQEKAREVPCPVAFLAYNSSVLPFSLHSGTNGGCFPGTWAPWIGKPRYSLPSSHGPPLATSARNLIPGLIRTFPWCA